MLVFAFTEILFTIFSFETIVIKPFWVTLQQWVISFACSLSTFKWVSCILINASPIVDPFAILRVCWVSRKQGKGKKVA